MSEDKLQERATYFFKLMSEGKSKEEMIQLMDKWDSGIREESVQEEPVKKTRKKSK